MEKFRDYQVTKNNNDVTVNYRIGLTAFGDGLVGGFYRSFGFNGAGYLPTGDMMVTNGAITDEEEKCAFILELDGQTLISHWEYVDTEKVEEGEILTVKVKLKNKLAPVSVAVCTKMDGSGAMSRWLEVTNEADHSVALGRFAPFSGMLEKTERWQRLMQENETSPYRLGYFENSEHMHEGQFKWHDLHTDCYTFGGRYTRNRYRHPFFVLENKAKGTAYAAQLAYSGGYKFSFDFRGYPNDGHLAITCELDGVKPLRMIDAGETLVSPEVVISMVNGDMDDAINNMHEHIRSAVMKKPHGPGCYTETAGGGNIDSAKAGAKLAKERGFDIFYIDAGWYFPAGEYCLAWTGTWDADPARFPNGMKELADYCHEIGIKLGLWMEPERIGSKSPVWEQDKDKCLRNYGDGIPGGHPTGGVGGLYDLSRKDVCDYIEAQICKMIETTGLDMFRLDFNVDYLAPHCYNMKDGKLESADLRYCENFYAMFDRIRNKYPNVIFENCASGGGRTDLGAVKYFDHTWVTDNPIAPRCFAITNGMTMCLPPELVDRLVTTMDAPKYASVDFNLFQLMFVRPTSHFPRGSENPLQIKYFKRFMELYNDFARPMLPKCKIYHHTPSQDDCEPKGVGILEEVSETRDRAMLGVFALCDPKKTEETVRFKGIDASKRYKVTAVEAEETFEISGYELKYRGLTVALRGALTAELFLAQAID